MKFTDGVEQALLKRDLPIITYYDFFVLGYALFQRREWDGEPLKRMPQGWDQTRANNAIKRMEERRALVPDVNGGAILGHGSDGIVLSRAA